jgi:hypothetical protein
MSEAWLRGRLALSPEPLRRRLEAAVENLDPGTDLAESLLVAAIDLLEDVRSRLHNREAAFELLVADGLLTLACEATAFSEPENAAERCRAMGPSGALGRVAERWARRS